MDSDRDILTVMELKHCFKFGLNEDTKRCRLLTGIRGGLSNETIRGQLEYGI